MTRGKRERRKRRQEAGRRGGIRSQEVQREKRMELHRDNPIYPVTPRWSIGLRDNWQRGEQSWITFRSWRDVLRRLTRAMAGLEIDPAACRSRITQAG